MSSEEQMKTLSGLAISHGFVSGPVFVLSADKSHVRPERVILRENVIEELARFHSARTSTRKQIEALIETLRANSDATGVDIFKNHLLIVDDPVLLREVENFISVDCFSAETAIHRVVEKYRLVFENMDDPYLRERVRDIEDIERRFLQNLFGGESLNFISIDKPSIIIAEDLTPSETVAIPRELVLGFATDRGSSTSHVSLLARSMGIPAVVGLGDITKQVESGERVLLDGTNGSVTINPDDETIKEFNNLVRRERELRALLSEGESHSGSMKDGTEIRLCANVQPGVPFGSLTAFGANGIGLYRSEYLWLGRDDEPSEEVQFEAYSEAVRAVRAMGDSSRVTFRVLDLGGDKLRRGEASVEDNPFLGNRSIRYLLSHLDVFRTQLRAILRASAFGNCAIMYPMVSTLKELRDANYELRQIMADLKRENIPFDEEIPIGVMIEVPAAALCAKQFASEVDFFSVGTNDLIQYTMAADRGNTSVSHLYQPVHPAVLMLMDMTIKAAKEANIPVCVCGETASDPVLGVLWVGMGVNELSMSASYIPVLKKTLRELSMDDAKTLVDEVRSLMMTKSPAAIYAYCREYLLKKVPQLEEIQTFFQ
jgi:phosphotransferase system enzyme I (PtsI)